MPTADGDQALSKSSGKVVRHARRLKVWFTKQIVHIDWIDFAASRLEEGLLFI